MGSERRRRILARYFGMCAGRRQCRIVELCLTQPRLHALPDRRVTSQVVELISVEPHGPAAIAGLREGDLIVALNERAVGTVDDIHRMLVGWPFDNALKVGVIRRDSRFEVSLVPVESR